MVGWPAANAVHSPQQRGSARPSGSIRRREEGQPGSRPRNEGRVQQRVRPTRSWAWASSWPQRAAPGGRNGEMGWRGEDDGDGGAASHSCRDAMVKMRAGRGTGGRGPPSYKGARPTTGCGRAHLQRRDGRREEAAEAPHRDQGPGSRSNGRERTHHARSHSRFVAWQTEKRRPEAPQSPSPCVTAASRLPVRLQSSPSLASHLLAPSCLSGSRRPREATRAVSFSGLVTHYDSHCRTANEGQFLYQPNQFSNLCSACAARRLLLLATYRDLGKERLELQYA